jgi:hypothetical protein
VGVPIRRGVRKIRPEACPALEWHTLDNLSLLRVFDESGLLSPRLPICMPIPYVRRRAEQGSFSCAIVREVLRRFNHVSRKFRIDVSPVNRPGWNRRVQKNLLWRPLYGGGWWHG